MKYCGDEAMSLVANLIVVHTFQSFDAGSLFRPSVVQSQATDFADLTNSILLRKTSAFYSYCTKDLSCATIGSCEKSRFGGDDVAAVPPFIGGEIFHSIPFFQSTPACSSISFSSSSAHGITPDATSFPYDSSHIL